MRKDWHNSVRPFVDSVCFSKCDLSRIKNAAVTQEQVVVGLALGSPVRRSPSSLCEFAYDLHVRLMRVNKSGKQDFGD